MPRADRQFFEMSIWGGPIRRIRERRPAQAEFTSFTSVVLNWRALARRGIAASCADCEASSRRARRQGTLTEWSARNVGVRSGAVKTPDRGCDSSADVALIHRPEPNSGSHGDSSSPARLSAPRAGEPFAAVHEFFSDALPGLAPPRAPDEVSAAARAGPSRSPGEGVRGRAAAWSRWATSSTLWRRRPCRLLADRQPAWNEFALDRAGNVYATGRDSMSGEVWVAQLDAATGAESRSALVSTCDSLTSPSCVAASPAGNVYVAARVATGTTSYGVQTVGAAASEHRWTHVNRHGRRAVGLGDGACPPARRPAQRPSLPARAASTRRWRGGN